MNICTYQHARLSWIRNIQLIYREEEEKNQLYGTAGIESVELCCSANLRNFHKCGGGRGVAWGSMWVGGREE